MFFYTAKLRRNPQTRHTYSTDSFTFFTDFTNYFQKSQLSSDQNFDCLTTYRNTANVNNDSNIDISDIVAVINIIAGQ